MSKNNQKIFSAVGVVGAGQMGSGIAQVIAQKNILVYLVDPHSSALEKAQSSIHFSLKKLHEKQKITLTPNEVLQNIQFVSHLKSLKNSELVIEAVPENKTLKQQVFKQIADIVSPKTVITSNTSSLPLTDLGKEVSHQERIMGSHFMNPVPLMKLVELIRTKHTSDFVFQKLLRFISFLDKIAVSSKDHPGFIVNRILMPLINSAVFTLQEETASAKDIDKAMNLGCGHPMGPLALADLIGLDTCLSIMEVLETGFGDKYAPCPLLKTYVKKGWLGKKTSKGFYTY